MSRRDDIRKLISNYNRRLQILKEKRALKGLDVEPDILIEIHDIEAEIKNLQIELSATSEQPEQTFKEVCLFQVDQQLTEALRNKYDLALYVPREEMETRFENFIQSDKNGLILIGESGTGKTNLLCHLARKWSYEGHLVLFYNCAGSLNINVEQTISLDIAPTEDISFEILVERVISEAHTKTKRVIWLFDGINEFRDGENRTGELLKRLDAIIGRARTPDLKLVFTCRTGTWENMVLLRRVSLFWNKYYPSPEQPLVMSRFNSRELEQAYPLYQRRFKIGSSLSMLSDPIREKLRDPLLLRINSVVYEGYTSIPNNPSIVVLAEYCKSQVGHRIKDTQFLERLATILLKQRTLSVSLKQMLNDPKLAPEVSDDPDCAFQRLKDSSIIAEMVDALYATVKFTYDRLFEYFIARHWLTQVNHLSDLAGYFEKALSSYEQFVPAWSAAAIAVSMIPDEKALLQTLLRLSSSLNYRIRQVAVDSLIAMYTDDPRKAKRYILHLIHNLSEKDSFVAETDEREMGMELPLRTALKVTRMVGDDASEIFLEAAASQTELQRGIVANELYVLWQQQPEIGIALLRNIISNIRPLPSSRPIQLLDFATRFSVNLFTSNCHRPEIVQQLSDAWWDEFEERYKIKDWFGASVTQSVINFGVQKAIKRGMAAPTTRAISLGGPIHMDRLLADTETKAAMSRLTEYLHPSSDVMQVLPIIATSLCSDLNYPNSLASLILTVHTFKDFDRMQKVLEQLFEELPGVGRLWLLFAFAFLAPVEVEIDRVVKLVENLTRRVQQENREDFFKGPQNTFEKFDVGLVPLGLTYGKWGLDMEFLSETILEASANDPPLLKRYVRGLAGIGLFFPKPILGLLDYVLRHHINQSDIREVVVQTLSTIGVIYNDEVEQFLLGLGVDEHFRNEVQAYEDATLGKHYLTVIGLRNNSAYGCLFYPRMRKMIQNIYRGATDSKDTTEFLAKYVQAYINLLRESNYRISHMIDRD